MIGVWPAWLGEWSYREPFLHSVRCGFTFFSHYVWFDWVDWMGGVEGREGVERDGRVEVKYIFFVVNDNEKSLSYLTFSWLLCMHAVFRTFPSFTLAVLGCLLSSSLMSTREDELIRLLRLNFASNRFFPLQIFSPCVCTHHCPIALTRLLHSRKKDIWDC
jgi:hypothetical protein